MLAAILARKLASQLQPPLNGTRPVGREMTVFEAKKLIRGVNQLRDALTYRDRECKWHFLKGPEEELQAGVMVMCQLG